MYRFLFLIVFLPSLALAQHPAINGKWYHASQGKYYKSAEREDIARSYEFKSGKTVRHSSCTDWCGCMRISLEGTYLWENDSIISITYLKEKGIDETTFSPMKKEKTIRLVIKPINKGLHITKLN